MRKKPHGGLQRAAEAAGEDRASVVAGMLINESDRGCAIFGAAILHDDLEDVLRAFCRKDSPSVKATVDPLFAGYGPLATFSGRIQVAFAFQLISRELFAKLECVRKLRNEFAHEAGPVAFDSPTCAPRVEFLIRGGESKPTVDAEAPGDPAVHAARRQLVDRIAFVIAVAEISAEIRVIRDCINEGLDPRLLTARFDQST